MAHSLPRVFFMLGCALFFSCPRSVPAQDSWSKSYPTRYTTIFYANDGDLHRFARNIGSGMSFMTENPEKNPTVTKNRVDGIVEAVQRLLDMHPPNLHLSIYIYKNQAELNTAYHRLGLTGAAPPAFYAHLTESVSLSLDTITNGMLAHEIAHAIICFHFGAPPPMRMQEILAQFVDKHLED